MYVSVYDNAAVLLQFLGKVGVVIKVGVDKNTATLVFTVRGAGFSVVTAALKKVS